MNFMIIKRRRVTHIGVPVRVVDMNVHASLCNKSWYAHDAVSIGEKEEISCKRCFKLAEEAEKNNGIVDLTKRTRRKKTDDKGI
jgi:hypothetical protein